MAMVLLLLIHCLLLLPLFVAILCLILVLFCYALLGVLLVFCGSSPWCHGLVCSVWVWYFLIIWIQTWTKKALEICISPICVPFQIALIKTTGLFMRYQLLGPEEAVWTRGYQAKYSYNCRGTLQVLML